MPDEPAPIDNSDEDLLHNLFPPTYNEATWNNVCEDFIDLLIADIDRWYADRPASKADDEELSRWIENFGDIIHAIATGIGHQDSTSRWNRAKVELSVNVSPTFAAEFQAEVTAVFNSTQSKLTELSACPPEFRWTAMDLFQGLVADNFYEYLRNCSRTLREKFDLPPGSVVAPEKKAPPPSKFQGLANWAKHELKRKEFLLVDFLCSNDGWASISDCQIECDWADVEYKSTMRRVNKKLTLGKQPWKICQSSKGRDCSGLMLSPNEQKKK